MNRLGASLTLFCVIVSWSSAALAYNLSGAGCDGNGQECVVNCDNGNRAGSMVWNGNVWTDGSKSDRDKDREAKAICAANGTACT
jgi:hypothetical protein